MSSALLFAASLPSTGCLVPEAPEYGPPGKTTPIIEWQNVNPPLYRILVPTRPQSFTIPVRSEDAGDRLILYLWVDYFHSGRHLDIWEFPPSTSGESRPLSASWSVSPLVTPGCHQLTMFVTHFSNYDFNADKGRDDRGVASVTWWANVDPVGDPNVLTNCPGGGPP